MGGICILTPGAPIDWDAVAAVAQAVAALIAAAAILVAVKAPEWAKAESRSDATHEILRATTMAIVQFNMALEDHRPSGKFAERAAKARMIKVALERLSERPDLTDGAIVVAAGSIALMQSILDQHDANMHPSLTAATRFVPSHVRPLIDVKRLTEGRAHLVIQYARDKKWPSWKRRFRDDPKINDLYEAGSSMFSSIED